MVVEVLCAPLLRLFHAASNHITICANHGSPCIDSHEVAILWQGIIGVPSVKQTEKGKKKNSLLDRWQRR